NWFSHLGDGGGNGRARAHLLQKIATIVWHKDFGDGSLKVLLTLRKSAERSQGRPPVDGLFIERAGDYLPAMPSRDPRVDAYIAQAPKYARAILNFIRQAIHKGSPDITET